MKIKHYEYNAFIIENEDTKITIDEQEALELVKIMSPKLVIPCHYNGDSFFIKNTNPADDQMFKREVEKMGFECKIMNYGDEIIL